MENGNRTDKRTSWGRPRDFVVYLTVLVLIGVAAVFNWQVLDAAFLYAWVAFFVLGTAAIFWHAWRHRGEPGAVRLGQVAILPRKLRLWVLGEPSSGTPNQKHHAPNSSSKRTGGKGPPAA